MFAAALTVVDCLRFQGVKVSFRQKTKNLWKLTLGIRIVNISESGTFLLRIGHFNVFQESKEFERGKECRKRRSRSGS